MNNVIRVFDYCYDRCANFRYSRSFSESPQASQTNSQLLTRMERILHQCMKLPNSAILDMPLPSATIEFPDGSSTHSWNQASSLRLEFARSWEWIQRLTRESNQGRCVELPHLCHLTSLDSLIKIIQSGAILVFSNATPGAWFSSKPELIAGDHGILVDLRHSPKGEYMYTDKDTWTGFQTPFSFKQKNQFHVAGIVVKQLEDAGKIRDLLKKTKKELPDHLFLTRKEAYFRTWLLDKAKKEINFLPIDRYLNQKGCVQIQGPRHLRYKKAALFSITALAFLVLAKQILRFERFKLGY